MASAVQIQIKVDNSQAIPEIDHLNEALSTVGSKGAQSFKQVGEAAASTGGHFQTNLDSVRLLSQEFGFRLPRAIESMLSRIPAVTTALSGMLGIMAGIAGAEVFAHVAEEAYKAWNEYISLNAQADKFYETLKKTQQEDIVNTRSIETTQHRLNTATGAATTNQQAAATFHGSALGDFMDGNIRGAVTDLAVAHQMATDAVAATSNMVKLGKVDLDQTHARLLAQIELNHAMDASLGPQAKASADDAKKRQIDAENRSFDRKQEMYYGNPSPGNAGADEQRVKDQTADAEYAAQSILIARKERDERIAAQNEAINAGLEGEAKYVAQRDEAISAISRKFQDGEISQRTAMSETASLSLKYDNERDARLEKQIQEAQQMVREAQQSGLTGGARITAEHNNAIDKINTDRTLDPQAAWLQRQAAAISATQKMSELEDQFADHVKSLDAGRVESSLNAFDRIDAAAQKEIGDRQKEYDQDFKNADMSNAQKLQADKNLQLAISTIDAAAAQQKQQLTERNQEEDLRYDQEAAEAERRVRSEGVTGWVASYKQGIIEIQAQEQQRLAKLQADIAKEGLTHQEAAKRQVDIEQTAAAQIEQQNQQMQQKIAGDLQAAFTNPVEFIKSQMEKMFFEIVAGWIMRMNLFKGLFGQTMGGLQPGAPGASGAGILGAIMQPHSGGASVPSFAGGSTSSVGSSIAGLSGTRGIVNGNPSISGTAGSYGTIGSGSDTVGSTISGVSSIANTIGGLTKTASGASSDASWDPLIKNAQDAGVSNGTGSTTAGASGTASSMSKIGEAGAVGMAGYSAAKTTINSFETGSPLKGALGDAAAGATIGTLAGPMGTLIGAAIGAGVGASSGILGIVTGEAGKLSARTYYEQSVLPQLTADMNNSGTDFQSAIADVGNTSGHALAYMSSKFGQDAAQWVNDNYMKKAASAVVQRITETATGGRQYTTMSAAQFHTGGMISDFGSLGTSSNEGFIHAMLNETVMNTRASSAHGPALNAMNSGASGSDIAAMYLAQSRPGGMPSSHSSGGDTHYHINTLDPKTMDHWLRNGGAKQITKHQNNYTSQYAGDGISG